MFTRHHHIRLAAVLRRQKPAKDGTRGQEVRMEHWMSSTMGIARMLQQDNPDFKFEKFLLACGMDML